MKDKRGVERGKCTYQGCTCNEYQLPWTGSQCCGACGHPPAKHVPQGGLPAPVTEERTPSQLFQTDGQGSSSTASLPTFMSYLPRVHSGTALPYSNETMQSLQLTSAPFMMPQSYALPPAPVQTVLDQSMCCQFPGCVKPKCTEDGRVHNFCGRTHAKMSQGQVAQQDDTQSLQNICKLPGCNQVAYAGHDCCGITHGRWYKGQQEQDGTVPVPCSRTMTAGAGQISQRTKCKNPQCGRRRFCSAGNVLEDFCGRSCSQAAQGVETCRIWPLAPGSQEYSTVTSQFMSSWTKKSPPPQSCFKAVFHIDSVKIEKRYTEYKSGLQGSSNEVKLFHGAPLRCNITSTQVLCTSSSCAVCGVSRSGFKCSKIATHVQFQRIGRAFYFAPNSSKCHEYTEGTNGYRALLLCDVAQGQMFMAKSDMTSLTSPPSGYNSVSANPSHHGGMNYPEVAVYQEEAVMPRYIVVYQHEGEKLLL